MSRQILNGWKQISNHIDRGVRTAQRWEALLGMPVHRPALKNRSVVVAFSDELELWLARTSPEAADKYVPICDKEAVNETLLRVLDKMRVLVQRSMKLIRNMRILQSERRRSRKIHHRRLVQGTGVRAARTTARVKGPVLAFPRRRHSLPVESRVDAGYLPRLQG